MKETPTGKRIFMQEEDENILPFAWNIAQEYFNQQTEKL